MNNSFYRNNKGFTMTEVMFAVIASIIVILAIITSWTFTYSTWTSETKKTNLRIDMIKALETMKDDIRLSSLTYMSFYPEEDTVYTAISMPRAYPDADGFYSLDGDGKVDWDETVVYHLYTSGGTTTLRRSVYSGYIADDETRYNKLEGIVTSGGGGVGITTDNDFLENIDTFEVSNLGSIVDFYDPSTTEIRSEKVNFGWAKFTSGSHTIGFEIVDKNPDSSGYDIGIDDIQIEPAGGSREAEYYSSAYVKSPASLTVDGGSVSTVQGSTWSNENYLKYDPSSLGDKIEFVDYYDLWRESSFDSVGLSNAKLGGTDTRVELDIPLDWDEDEKDTPSNLIWSSSGATGDAEPEDIDIGDTGFTMRVQIHQNDLSDVEDDDNGMYMIRVKFQSSSEDPLTIGRAYITLKDETSAQGYDGYSNQNPGALDVEEYHRHQQLFFEDESTGDIIESITIPKDSEAWTVWTAFPIRDDVNYFVSFYLPYAGTTISTKMWDSKTSTDAYYVKGDGDPYLAGKPDWSQEVIDNVDLEEADIVSTKDIYAITEMDFWSANGYVESRAFDTAKTAPITYGTIQCSKPVGATVYLKARTSSDEAMSSALDWDSINWGTINGTNQYLQFRAQLETDLYWYTGGYQRAYGDYVSDQMALQVYQFPSYSGDFLVTGVYSTWLDDVEIDWPGDDRICAVTGYITRKNNYGRANVTVDGMFLVGILSIDVKVEDDETGEVLENIIEMEPRNTGK